MTTESGAGQGSGQAQGATDGGTGGQGDQGGQQQQQQQDQFDKDRAMATIKAQRESEKQLTTELKEARDKLKALEDEKLSDDEKKTARLTEAEKEKAALEAKVAELLTDSALTDAAVQAGATKPAAVSKLADRSTVKRAEDGSVTNATEVVAKVKEAYPELFGDAPAGSADGGARGGNQGSKKNMNDWIRERASR